MQTRRDFLKVAGWGGVAAATVGCSPEETLPRDLTGIVNEIGIEGTKRKNIEDKAREISPYPNPFSSFIRDYVGSDWRHIALEMVLDEKRQAHPEYPIQEFRLRDVVNDQVGEIKKESPLYIKNFSIKSGKLLKNDDSDHGHSVWGKAIHPSKLVIDVIDDTKISKYSDQWVFEGRNNLSESENDNKDDSYSRKAIVTLASKKENIQKIQAAYGISEAEATTKLNQWLPKVLATAHKLYIAPEYFPQENWLPDNKLTAKRTADYMYRTKSVK